MEYRNSNNQEIKYDVDTLMNENGQPFAVIISEAKGSQAEVSQELIERASSCVFRSEGNHTVFLEMQNGNYKEFPVNVSLDKEDNTRFVAELQKEPLECSPNLVKAFQEKASVIISSNPERAIQYQASNEDQIITRE